MTTNLPRNNDSLNWKCHGSPLLMNQQSLIATPVAKKLVGYCEPTTEILPKQNFTSKSPQPHHPDFPPRNGNKFSKASLSTSTKSSLHSIMLSLMKRERVAWETQKSLSGFQKQRNESPPLLSGPLHGEEHRKRSDSLFLTGKMNSSTMETTSNQNSLQNTHRPIINSCSTTLPYETKLQPVIKSSLLTRIGSVDSTQPLLCQTESSIILKSRKAKQQET